MWVSYNFNLIQEQDLRLSFLNRGFQYNDGLFDTLLLIQGKIRFLNSHLERMHRAMQVLGLKFLPQLAQAKIIEEAILILTQKNNLPTDNLRVKINIWRKPGGLFTPESDEAEILITLQPQAALQPIIKKAGFFTEIPNRFTPLTFFKGPYALHYVQAGLAKKKANWDEIILLDDKENISETSVANIFWVKDKQLFTPSLETGCIAGIMRSNILRICRELNIETTEGFFNKNELLSAKVIFTTNVTGLRFIQEINSHPFSTSHPLISSIQQKLLSC